MRVTWRVITWCWTVSEDSQVWKGALCLGSIQARWSRLSYTTFLSVWHPELINSYIFCGSVRIKKYSKPKWDEAICSLSIHGCNLIGVGRNLSFPFMGQLEIWAELTYRIWNFPLWLSPFRDSSPNSW